MSPTADLSPAATSGSAAGTTFSILLRTDDGSPALPYLVGTLAAAVGRGGNYDYQRMGPQSAVLGLGMFQQLPQFRDVSNFDVGLFAQQAGLTLDETLKFAGVYAQIMSSNKNPDRPYGLDPRTAELTILGYTTGATGVYGNK